MVYAAIDLNPHCSLRVIDAEVGRSFAATNPTWSHWRLDNATSPYWYRSQDLEKLIALLLQVERSGGKSLSVNEFIRGFSGLSGTAKAKEVASKAGLTKAMLHDLVVGNNLDRNKIQTSLLPAMLDGTRPIKPEKLGMLGPEHCKQRLLYYDTAIDSIEYRVAKGIAYEQRVGSISLYGLPYYLEIAFGINNKSELRRTLHVGVNFSPSLYPPFRDLDDALNDALCGKNDPVMLLVHITCPRIDFTDRGKTKATLPSEIVNDLRRLIKLVTAKFTQAKRKADREGRIPIQAFNALRNDNKSKPMTVKAAAYQVMEQAYLKASSGGTLPANARQIMYAARPLIIELTGKTTPWSDSATFTQGHLNDYIAENSDKCAKWDVVFDDRGHFTEPHTGKSIGIGTLKVRGYIQGWHQSIGLGRKLPEVAVELETHGPALRYRFALFIEKEGFMPLLEKAQIAERYDLAIMSTKGMSTTSARKLTEQLSNDGVTILVLHDFDKVGFTICHTLQNDTRRYQFKSAPKVIDIGLRIGDVEELGLEKEAVEYKDKEDPRQGIIERGATQDEANFLVRKENERWIGDRVELNAMDSRQFLDWLERKLQAHSVEKFIPDNQNVLKREWERRWSIQEINRQISLITMKIPSPPDDLLEQIRRRFKQNPTLSWDAALFNPQNVETA